MPNEQPKKGKLFSDVAQPGRTPSSATSRPLLVTHEVSHVDPIVNAKPTSLRHTMPKPLPADIPQSRPRIIAFDTIENVTQAAPKESMTEQPKLNEPEVPQPETKNLVDPDAVAKLLLAHDPKTVSNKKSKRSTKRKIVIGILIIMVIAALAYNAVLLNEYLQLK